MSADTHQRETSQGEIIARLGTGPIPARPYYERAYFDLEAAAIFRRSWLQIGHVCELPQPGSFMVRPIEVANASILITRGPDDVIRAFHNVCAHRGSQLVYDESGQKSAFTCMYHAWNFGYDGKLRAAPDFEQFYVEKSQCDLSRVSVDVVAGLIFVNLDPAPKQSLRDFLGPMAARMEALPVARATTFSEYVYEWDANWKLIYDNFQENYHLRFVHARSGAPGGTTPENPFGYPDGYTFMGPHRIQTIAGNSAFRPAEIQGFALGKQAAFAAADGFQMGPHNRALFPNMFMFSSVIQPWSHTIMPLGPNRSRGVLRFYWVGEDRNATQSFSREYAVAMAREVHAEDRVAVEGSQRGLSSGALQHIHFQAQEVLCRHFFHLVNDMVEEYKSGLQAPPA